jgi:hypothetical protein
LEIPPSPKSHRYVAIVAGLATTGVKTVALPIHFPLKVKSICAESGFAVNRMITKAIVDQYVRLLIIFIVFDFIRIGILIIAIVKVIGLRICKI